jgi:hypothetical protein
MDPALLDAEKHQGMQKGASCQGIFDTTLP